MKSNIDIIGKLLVIARALERAGDEILSSFGITMGMYEILMFIADNTNTTTKLANISQITLASITHKTKHMENKGYIKRVVSKEDKRIWYFSLTNKGRSLLETILAVYEEITVPLFANFPESDKQQTLTLLTATEEHLRHVLQNRKSMVDYVDKVIEQKGLKLKK
jgi:DNA-binding MarR family transcriptional regulator